MGYRICYLASKLPPKKFADIFNLEIIDTTTEMPHNNWWIASLKNSDWSLLWSEDEDFGRRSQDLIKSASCKSDLIYCVVNETCMWSSSEYWSNGQLIWQVTHAGDGDDIFNLNVKGKLPPQFEDIREKHISAQKQEDDCDHIFGIPLELARVHINFRHEDQLEPNDVDEFHLISAPRKPNFFHAL